jgi:hypothetical protein
MTRLTDLSRRVGADLLLNVDARDRSGGIRKSSVLIGPDGSRGEYYEGRGWCRFGEYLCRCGHYLVGWPGTPRRRTRTEGAAADRSSYTLRGSPSDR